MLVKKGYVSVNSETFFISPNQFNVQLMLVQDKNNSVQVSFISGSHSLIPVLAIGSTNVL